jgi:SAM-dependent methyltransferase
MSAIAQNINFGGIQAHSYDADYRRFENYNGKDPDSKIIETVQQNLPQKADIADIGAGDGRNTIPLAKLGHNVDAFELSDEGREIILTRADDLPNVKVSYDNITHQPFKKAYDGVVMAHVTQHFNFLDIYNTFKNISDGVKKGGVFIFDALVDKHDKVEGNKKVDEFHGTCHFRKDFLAGLADKTGFDIMDIEDYKEKASSRGDYYGPKWGFVVDDVNDAVRDVKLKWFTLKKR